MTQNSAEGAAFVTGGAATGAWVSVTVGGMGLAFKGTAVALGMAPITAAGAVTGAATYGVFKAIVEGDASALGAAAVGGLGGAGVSVTVGGMGLAFKGTAVSLGMAPVTVAGAVVGLAVYGLLKIIDKPGTRETAFQTSDRMEEKVLWQEAYTQALIEVDPTLFELNWQQKFAELEIESEFQALKAQMQKGSSLSNEMQKLLEALKTQKWPENALKLNFTQFKDVDFNFSTSNPTTNSSVIPESSADDSPQTAEIEAEALSIKLQPSQTWKCVQTLKAHTGSVNSVAISPDGQTLASGSGDKTVSLWNLKTGKRIYTFFGQAQAVYSVAISPDGQTVASGSGEQKITRWQLDTRALLSPCFYLDYPYSHSGFVFSVAFSADGQTIASGSGDKTIRLWSRYTGKYIRTLIGHSDTVWSVAISPDGETLASGSADQTIRLWSLSGSQQPRILTGHSGWVNSVAISPDGHILASGSTDSTIKLWNLHNGELLRTLVGQPQGAAPTVMSVAISPDGQTLASGSKDGVNLWNLYTGELLSTLSGRGCVAFSLDGQTLVSGTEGGTIKIWSQMLGADESTLDPVLSGEWYSVLGVDKGAHPDDVKRAYRRLARQYHPDFNRSANAKVTMQALNKAYQEFQQFLTN